MPRVDLNELPSYEFQHPLTVRSTDINYAGHLGNESLLGLVHEARAQFLKRLSFNTIINKKNKIGLIIADIVVNFKAEAFAGDKLVIDCQIKELGEKSFRLFHRVRDDQLLIALIESGMVAFDYEQGKAVPIPKSFIRGLEVFRSAR
jgi:acyl-CoA thioester hydrolase